MKKVLFAALVAPLVIAAMPLLASAHTMSGNTVVVTNSNNANVTNTVTTDSSTGNNTANGGNGWVSGGKGGSISTGESDTETDLLTVANSNLTVVSPTSGYHSSSAVVVSNDNNATVKNQATTNQSTGYNTADGGSGFKSGNGGSVSTGGAGSLTTVSNYLNFSITKVN